MAPRVLLFGSGAIGTIYVYLLLKAGCNVTAVCRSNYEAAKRSGFHIDSDRFGKDIYIEPQIVKTPLEAAKSLGENEHFDYVFVCSKALPGSKPTTSELIDPAVAPGKTTIVLIQNGIGIEDEYLTAFPDNILLSCVVYLPTTQLSPGHIKMGNVEQLEIGTYPASAYQRTGPARAVTELLAQTLQSGGSNVKIFEDIQARRWSKLLLNASWNPICALTQSRDVAYLASSSVAEPWAKGVMLEVAAIARAMGYDSITPETVEEQMKRATDRIGTPGIEPSMLVDVLQGRRMEVEVILGNPIRIAKEKGVDVPRMEGLYALTKALDESAARRQPGKSLGGDETAKAKGKSGA